MKKLYKCILMSLTAAGAALHIVPVLPVNLIWTDLLGRVVRGGRRWILAFLLLATPSLMASSMVAISSVAASGAATVMRGTLSAAAGSSFQLNFYENLSPDFTTGNVYLGAAAINTDAGGSGSFLVSLPFPIPANSYVSATATDNNNRTSPFATALQFTPVNPANLSLSVSESPSGVQKGNQLSFAITVTNSGTIPATGVVVNDLLPEILNFAYSQAGVGTASAVNNIVTWNAGTIAAGGSATMTVYATGMAVGVFTNVTTLSQSEYNLNFANCTNQLSGSVFLDSPIVVTTQPTPQLLNLGALLNLVVGLVGSTNVHYQWRLNGANIPGATNATYAKAGLLSLDGGLYTVVVSDQYGATTSQGALISLAGLLSLPASDNFASRGILINLLGPETCNNINATSEVGEPMHAGVPGGKSVWFTWTPLLSGVATITTAGSSFDTLLAVYTGNSLNNLTEVASDDDDGGYFTSKVVFNAVGGTTYSIAVDGAYGASGQIALSATENILAPAIPKITTQPASQVVASNGMAQFSVAGTGSGLSYQWSHNGVAISGATSSSYLVKNAAISTVGLYTVTLANSSGSVTSKAANLQISILDGSVNPNGVAFDKYQTAYTYVTGAPSPSGVASLSMGPQSLSKGNSVSSAGGTSRGYSSTQVFTAYGTSTQTGEPNHCGTSGGDSTWSTIQAADNGVMVIDTDGTTFPTVLAVYTGNGSDFSSLTSVTCDVGSGRGGTNSSVTFAATSNTVYYIAVDGVYGQSGTVILNANLSVPPSILSQPISQTATPGTTINLTASITGHDTPGTQWWYNGSPLTGATNSTLTITNFQPSKAGTYLLMATNKVGSAFTSPVALLPNTVMHLDTFSFNKTSHACQMRLVGTANTSYVIQASTDMIHWIPVATNVPSAGLWTYTDPIATNGQRFYRAVPGH